MAAVLTAACVRNKGFPCLLLSNTPTRLHTAPTRLLWGWLNTVFNKVDDKRIEQVGPDRAAAEWLLRCGAHVRFKDRPSWQRDYNTLPTGPPQKYKIEEIDATDSGVMHIGFEHFKHLQHVKSLKLNRCMYITDECIGKLHLLAGTLQHLEVTSCGNVTDKGLMQLKDLSLLETLRLFDLPAVRDKTGTVHLLEKFLANCEINAEGI
ncbi:ATP synthase subunit s, mitochondrial-like [Branchiostoma floridae]|uniref:ATP synthase subunit s, mitochondrial-like n=2 Tax=Branchiostoma floridae TaxID=7739 RepID=A0A9J7L3X2_BRAFL|nr:ATP synthase subunit s, mitochondrial-like [Branchiostoma floridae]